MNGRKVGLLIAISIIVATAAIFSAISFWRPERRDSWGASRFFTDSGAVAICESAAADDWPEVDRLIASGADVNAKGRGSVTLLLLAMQKDVRAFEQLLERDADPNICLTEKVELNGTNFDPGVSVIELAARRKDPTFLELILRNGGDVNLVNPSTKRPLLFSVLRNGGANLNARVKLLIDNGVDLSIKDGDGIPPALFAVGWYYRYDTAQLLVQSGADPEAIDEFYKYNLIDRLLLDVDKVSRLGPEVRASHSKLLDYLIARGASLEQAKERVKQLRK